MSNRKTSQDPMVAKYNRLSSMQKFLYLKDFRKVDKAMDAFSRIRK